MRKLGWGATYVAAFILAFVAGFVSNILGGHDFLGLGDVHWDDSTGTIETDISYADGELNKFDLYLPRDKDRATKLVLYIHAGGFTSGDKSDDATIAKSFASRGYVAATINYSLRTAANKLSVRDMTFEIAQGVDKIAQAVTERGYDLGGMVIAGGSAGGSLAMIYAYRDGAQAPVPVEAVISLVGPASFEPAAWFGFEDNYTSAETAEAGAAFVTLITGAEVTPEMMRSGEYQDRLADVSPLSLVTSEAPPTLLAYGELDKVAPYAASRDLPPTLSSKGVPHDALIFPNSGHALNRDPSLTGQLGRKIIDYLDRYAPLG